MKHKEPKTGITGIFRTPRKMEKFNTIRKRKEEENVGKEGIWKKVSERMQGNMSMQVYARKNV